MLTQNTAEEWSQISWDFMMFSKQMFPGFIILLILALATQSELLQTFSDGICMWEVVLSECLRHDCSRDVSDSRSLFSHQYSWQKYILEHRFNLT